MIERLFRKMLFASRWLQLPLYLGLILAQCVYVFHFWVELVHLVGRHLHRIGIFRPRLRGGVRHQPAHAACL